MRDLDTNNALHSQSHPSYGCLLGQFLYAAASCKAESHACVTAWRPSWPRKVIWTRTLVCFLLAVCGLAVAEPQQRGHRQEEADRKVLLAFSQKSAPELVSHYFNLSSPPLFVIRRLINLGDPRVIPALRDAFERETQPLIREFLAAALDRLGDPDVRYFDYVAGAALDAINADIPFGSSSTTVKTNDGNLQHREEIRDWAVAHGVSATQAINVATVELPGAIEALALTADRRSVPILLRALRSPNILVVREAALGLARIQETAAIEPIIAACRRLDPEELPWTAKSLLYFRSEKAQQAASVMIVNPTKLQRWRTNVAHEEVLRTTVANLSNAVQRLDLASIKLDRYRQAMRAGDSAEAKRSLKEYTGEFNQLRKSILLLSGGNWEDGLAVAVLDRLKTQISQLEQIAESESDGSNKIVEKPLRQLRVLFGGLQGRVIQELPELHIP